MKRIGSTIGLLGIALLLATPALAQGQTQAQAPQQPSRGTPAPSMNPRLSGNVQKAQNNWRGRTLLGAAVFNDAGRRIATLNDLLITDDGRVDRAVLAIGGIRRRFVAVPFSQLRLVQAGAPSQPAVAADGAPLLLPMTDQQTYAVTLPGATRESLLQMEQFRF